MRLLSFDCGNKSLAAIGMQYDENWAQTVCAMFQPVRKVTSFKMGLAELERQNSILDNIIAYIKYGRFQIQYSALLDLLPGKNLADCDAIERAVALRPALEKIKREYPADKVLVEFQMGPNDKSRGVSYQILYEFGDKCYLMPPALKNDIDCGGGALNEFTVKYSTAWYANKSHATANFRAFLRDSGQQCDNIKHDTADAFLQCLAYDRFGEQRPKKQTPRKKKRSKVKDTIVDDVAALDQLTRK